ncbi:hypothetical protein NDU88_005139 [Pleurodeles waltl]|uniref:Uncharacterized protein n=1 Tax=Pleurodeles waltl TaxID=8319 RepID=A0AAV7L0C9_PLEWA|nr:hypothetical protein NDU88_005139 [Pleurodeles waltl]
MQPPGLGLKGTLIRRGLSLVLLHKSFGWTSTEENLKNLPLLQLRTKELCLRYHAERESFEEAEYYNEFPQEEPGRNAGEDVLEALDASFQHSINKALAAALRPITAQLQLYAKGQGRSTPSTSKLQGEFSEVSRKQKDKSKG